MKVPSAMRLNHRLGQLAQRNLRDGLALLLPAVLQAPAKFRVDTRAFDRLMPVLVAD